MGMQKQVRVSALYQSGTQMRYVAAVKAPPPLAGSTAVQPSDVALTQNYPIRVHFLGFKNATILVWDSGKTSSVSAVFNYADRSRIRENRCEYQHSRVAKIGNSR